VDFPEYDFRKGQRGVVITELQHPCEAYDLEIEGESGEFLGFAYSVKPDQIANLSGEALERGLEQLSEGNIAAAYRELRLAIKLRHSYIGTVLHSVLRSFADVKEWVAKAFYLRFVMQLDPDYEYARNNLAITFLNWGVEEAMEGNLPASLLLFNRALAIKSAPDVDAKIKENIAATYHQYGVQSHSAGRLDDARAWMRLACHSYPDEKTRRNLGTACVLLALSNMEQRDYEGAVSAFEEAEDAGLLLPELLNDYAIALVFSDKMDEAKLAFERALELEPESDILRDNLEKLNKDEAKETLTPREIKASYIPIPPPVVQMYQMAA
jgi:tetratricopeptide (TPR) repeat protein